MTVLYDQVVMAYDMSVFSSGGQTYIKDFGPAGLHAQFGAGAAAPVPQLDGSLLFSGAQFATLPLEFYDVAPTQQYTWLVVVYPTVDQHMHVFSCYDAGAGGTQDGIILYRDAALDRMVLYQLQGGATFPRIDLPTNGLLAGRKRLILATMEATPRALVDGSRAVASWGLGVFAGASYNTVIVPRIGSDPAGSNFIVGRLSYLALVKNALSSIDLSQLSGMLADGVKPWCYR